MISNLVYTAALNVLASADRLVLTSGDVANSADLSLKGLGWARPRFSIYGITLTVLPVRDGESVASGTARYWALVSGQSVLASGPLADETDIRIGHLFTTNGFEINFAQG